MTTTEIIVTEFHELHLLTAQMQRHVDRTLAADRKGGEALWEKALAVADARAEATKGGEWGAFLNATGQHERAARRLVAIAERGRLEERFRNAIISGWLTFSVGAIAAQADDELLTNLLEQPTPPTHNQVKALTARPDNVVRSQLTAQPDNVVGSLVVEDPTNPLAAVIEVLRKDDTKAAYAAACRAGQASGRAFAAIDARVDGKSIPTVLAMREAPTVPTVPTVPTALSAFPPGHEDARWRLKQALTAAEAMQDATIRAGRIAEIRDVADAHKIDLDAPIIEAPQATPVKKTSPTSQAILLQHAESMLAGVIEAIPDTAINLVAALVCWEYEPYSGGDPREALFQTLKILAKDNLDVVETAIEKGRS